MQSLLIGKRGIQHGALSFYKFNANAEHIANHI